MSSSKEARSNIGCALLSFIFISLSISVFAQEKQTLEFLVGTKDPIYLESKPMVSSHGSQLYFIRSRFAGTDYGDEQDIWVADFKFDGASPMLRSLGPSINRFKQNRLAGISANGQEMIVVNDKFDNAPLMRFRQRNGKWKTVEEIIIRDFYDIGNERDFHYSFTEEVILMSLKQSDHDHGQDMFVSFPRPDNKWSKPMNLGTMVNSTGDDTAPFLATDGRGLFYSSTKAGGEGKADIYFSYRLDDSWNNWSAPVNLGNTINSKNDENYISVSKDFKFIYYDSHSPIDQDKTIYRSLLPSHIIDEHVKQRREYGDRQNANQPTALPEADVPYQSRLRHRLGSHVSATGQFTQVYQYQSALKNAKYSGPVSISDKPDAQALTMLTIHSMFNLWRNNEILISPEIQRGNGIGNGAGMGAYPNAMYAYPQNLPFFSRAQIRQYFNVNPSRRLLKYHITLGRFNIQDMTDKNPYASDTQKDFINFAHTMLLAWDAAATAYGYTHGIAQSFIFKRSKINFFINTVNAQPGGNKTDWKINKGHSLNLQYVYGFNHRGKTGKIRLLGYYSKYNGGNFGNYHKDKLTGGAVYDSAHSYATKVGGAIDINYNVSRNWGLFLRYSQDDGKQEDFGYTQADASVNGGALFAMTSLNRPADRLGITSSYNALSRSQRQFLNEGGTGFMLGDGNLNYAPEIVFEVFYSINFLKHFFLAFNYQNVIHVGYNADRGNAHFLTARLSIDI